MLDVVCASISLRGVGVGERADSEQDERDAQGPLGSTNSRIDCGTPVMSGWLSR